MASEYQANFSLGFFDLRNVHVDSSHATGSVLLQGWQDRPEGYVMARGSGCGISLSTQVARAFCSTPFALSGMSAHTHTHTCTLLGWEFCFFCESPSPTILQHP